MSCFCYCAGPSGRSIEVIMTQLRRTRTLKERLKTRIRRARGDVFVPRDFADLGEYNSVKRALRQLIVEGEIARLGYGVYARVKTNGLTGRPMLAVRGGFDGAVRQTLSKLKVDWRESDTVRQYNNGRTTQVQANPVFEVQSRFNRKLRYRNLEARFEKPYA
ncbi:hypothetical protein GLX_22670 [Komagataeibacter medellinensis NBRC 3288]|nr:hypothetical protein GLX_22670 [Komagataeibacter medellinensis NBRC 3288]